MMLMAKEFMDSYLVYFEERKLGSKVLYILLLFGF